MVGNPILVQHAISISCENMGLHYDLRSKGYHRYWDGISSYIQKSPI